MKKLTIAIAMMGATAMAAQATPIVFNFDDLAQAGRVPTNYQGATWENFFYLSQTGAGSQPNIAFNVGSTATFSYGAGFTALSFYVGGFSPGTFSVYEGLNGTGALLGSNTFSDVRFDAFVPASVSFDGIGRSVVVRGASNQIGWDSVTIEVNNVPEPASLALVGLGLIGIAAARRKARK